MYHAMLCVHGLQDCPTCGPVPSTSAAPAQQWDEVFGRSTNQFPNFISPPEEQSRGTSRYPILPQNIQDSMIRGMRNVLRDDVEVERLLNWVYDAPSIEEESDRLRSAHKGVMRSLQAERSRMEEEDALEEEAHSPVRIVELPEDTPVKLVELAEEVDVFGPSNNLDDFMRTTPEQRRRDAVVMSRSATQAGPSRARSPGLSSVQFQGEARPSRRSASAGRTPELSHSDMIRMKSPSPPQISPFSPLLKLGSPGRRSPSPATRLRPGSPPLSPLSHFLDNLRSQHIHQIPLGIGSPPLTEEQQRRRSARTAVIPRNIEEGMIEEMRNVLRDDKLMKDLMDWVYDSSTAEEKSAKLRRLHGRVMRTFPAERTAMGERQMTEEDIIETLFLTGDFMLEGVDRETAHLIPPPSRTPPLSNVRRVLDFSTPPRRKTPSPPRKLRDIEAKIQRSLDKEKSEYLIQGDMVGGELSPFKSFIPQAASPDFYHKTAAEDPWYSERDFRKDEGRRGIWPPRMNLRRKARILTQEERKQLLRERGKGRLPSPVPVEALPSPKKYKVTRPLPHYLEPFRGRYTGMTYSQAMDERKEMWMRHINEMNARKRAKELAQHQLEHQMMTRQKDENDLISLSQSIGPDSARRIIGNRIKGRQEDAELSINAQWCPQALEALQYRQEKRKLEEEKTIAGLLGRGGEELQPVPIHREHFPQLEERAVANADARIRSLIGAGFESDFETWDSITPEDGSPISRTTSASWSPDSVHSATDSAKKYIPSPRHSPYSSQSTSPERTPPPKLSPIPPISPIVTSDEEDELIANMLGRTGSYFDGTLSISKTKIVLVTDEGEEMVCEFSEPEDEIGDQISDLLQEGAREARHERRRIANERTPGYIEERRKKRRDEERERARQAARAQRIRQEKLDLIKHREMIARVMKGNITPEKEKERRRKIMWEKEVELRRKEMEERENRKVINEERKIATQEREKELQKIRKMEAEMRDRARTVAREEAAKQYRQKQMEDNQRRTEERRADMKRLKERREQYLQERERQLAEEENVGQFTYDKEFKEREEERARLEALRMQEKERQIKKQPELLQLEDRLREIFDEYWNEDAYPGDGLDLNSPQAYQQILPMLGQGQITAEDLVRRDIEYSTLRERKQVLEKLLLSKYDEARTRRQAGRDEIDPIEDILNRAFIGSNELHTDTVHPSDFLGF